MVRGQGGAGRLNLKQVVDEIRRDKNLGEEDIDVGEAKRAIVLWKGALIRPTVQATPADSEMSTSMSTEGLKMRDLRQRHHF